MKTQGFVIARNRARSHYFTASSSYDRPNWIPLAEATVYLTADLANAAFSKLARGGAYECRIVSMTEAIELQMPSTPELPDDSGQMDVNFQPDDEGNTEMVAADQSGEDPDELDQDPDELDQDPDADINQMVDDQLSDSSESDQMVDDSTDPGDPDEFFASDADPFATDEFGSRMTPVGKELAQRIDFGRRGMAESVAPTSLGLKTPDVISYKDPAYSQADAETNKSVDSQHEEKIKVPADVMSDLKSCIASYNKEAKDFAGHNNTRASFCMTVVSAFEQLLKDLEDGTVAGVKQAQIHMSSYMNPITSNLPVSVQKFIMMGGRKSTLKNLFDDKRQQQKLDEVSNELLNRYVDKSDAYVAKATGKRDYKSGDDPKAGKRIDGAMKAVNKMYKAYNPPRDKATK